MKHTHHKIILALSLLLVVSIVASVYSFFSKNYNAVPQSAAVVTALGVDAFITPGIKSLRDNFDPNVYTPTPTGKSIFVSPFGLDTNAGDITTPLASIQKAFDLAKPGDTVYLRGGTYHQVGYTAVVRNETFTLNLSKSGTVTTPIYIRNYANETPVLSGAEPLTFKPCTVLTTCAELPQASNLFVATLPPEFNVENTTVYEDGSVMPLTRTVPAERPFFSDNVKNGHSVYSGKEFSETTLTDAAIFNQLDPLFYSGVQLWINSCNNNLKKLAITKFNPATHQITFKPIGCPTFLDAKTDKYVLVNIPQTVRSGEMFINKKNNQIVVWPKNPINIVQKKITLAKITGGIYFNNASNVFVSGLTFTRFSGSGMVKWAGSSGGDNLIIFGNSFLYNGGAAIDLDVTNNVRIAKNDISYQGGAGIALAKATRAIVSHNRVTMSLESGIRLYSSTDSWIHNNAVYNSGGHHANAYTLGYLENNGALIEKNFSRNAGISLTLKTSSNMVYADNTFFSPETTWPFAAWPGLLPNGSNPKNIVLINNTIVRENSKKKVLTIGDSFQNVTLIGNRFSDSDVTINKNPSLPNPLIEQIVPYNHKPVTAVVTSSATGTVVMTKSKISFSLNRTVTVYKDLSVAAKKVSMPVDSRGVLAQSDPLLFRFTKWQYVFFDNGTAGFVPVRYLKIVSSNPVVPVVVPTPTTEPSPTLLQKSAQKVIVTRTQAVYGTTATVPAERIVVGTVASGTTGYSSTIGETKVGLTRWQYVFFNNGVTGYIPAIHLYFSTESATSTSRETVVEKLN